MVAVGLNLSLIITISHVYIRIVVHRLSLMSIRDSKMRDGISVTTLQKQEARLAFMRKKP